MRRLCTYNHAQSACFRIDFYALHAPNGDRRIVRFMCVLCVDEGRAAGSQCFSLRCILSDKLRFPSSRSIFMAIIKVLDWPFSGYEYYIQHILWIVNEGRLGVECRRTWPVAGIHSEACHSSANYG